VGYMAGSALTSKFISAMGWAEESLGIGTGQAGDSKKHISRESPYTPYIVGNQLLKSLHNSLHFLKSPYIIDGQRLKSLH
jgi:hypothetical protein